MHPGAGPHGVGSGLGAGEGEPRYQPVRELGRGAMGIVVLARDRVRGGMVAQKRMRDAGASARLRLKREFRVVEALSHPNLVRLYELGEDDAGLYFTMEPVEGMDLLSACRDDPQALWRALPQLLDALSHLHAAGVVHRDVKPSNVLMRRDGVVKLLDFGLAAQLQAGRLREDRLAAGTLGYIAPEVLRGEGASPASDVYSLGAMIFEIASGRRLPADRGASLGADGSAPRLRTVAPGADRRLDEACASALAVDPARRGTTEELARLLGPKRAAVAPAAREASRRELVGRDAVNREVMAAIESCRLVLLSGPTGAGKSAVAAWCAAEAERTGRVVLRGAARPTERVAFNAFDGVIGELAALLASHPPASPAERDDLAVAATSFPELVRIDARERARRRVRAGLFAQATPASAGAPLRAGVFAAIGRLIEAARRGGVGALVVIDDFQWADDDSVALASHLVEAGASSTRYLLVVRDDVEPSVASRWLADRAGARVIAIPPLGAPEIARIVRVSAREAAEGVGDDALDPLVAWCGGRPFLAELAGRALGAGRRDAGSAERILESALASSSGRDRELVATLVAADGWTPLVSLAELVGRELGEVDDGVAHLEQLGLVRRGGAAGVGGSVDVYHDGVRQAALALLDAAEIERAHSTIADWMLGPRREHPTRPLARSVAPERAVRHLLGAGREPEAAACARWAAASAEQQGAFGLAADLYEVALRSPEGAAEELLAARAVALGRGGRHGEAAACWARLARGASGDRRTDLLLHEAHALVAAARITEGLSRLEDALRSSGREGTETRGLAVVATVARFVLGPLRRPPPRRAAPVDADRVRRAERDVKIGILLSFIDPLTGIAFLQRAQRGFERAGAHEQAAMCDYTFAVHALIGSRRVGWVPLSAGYRRAAERRTRGTPIRRGELVGMPHFIDGLGALRQGRWDDARRLLAQASAVFAGCGATSEGMLAASWGMMADVYTQDLPAMKRHLAWFRRNLSECGDTLIVAHVELLAGYVLVLEGAFADARRTIEDIAGLFQGARHDTQRDAARLYRHLPDVYLDDGRRARREYAAALHAAGRQRFLDTMFAGAFATIGATLEANALRSGDREASAKRVEELARIVDVAPPFAAGSSWRARAYAADAAGRPARALDLLAVAEERAGTLGRRLDAAVARWQRGVRLGGDAGAALCSDAEAVVAGAGAASAILREDAGLR